MVLILLEGNPKDKSWAAAAKMMNNVDKFLERLRTYKAAIDEGKARAAPPQPCLRAHVCVHSRPRQRSVRSRLPFPTL